MSEGAYANPTRSHRFPEAADAYGRIGLRLAATALAALLCAAPQTASAQGTKADYERSDGWQARVRDKVFRDVVRPQWIDGGKALWYRVRTGPRSHEYVLAFAEPAAPSPSGGEAAPTAQAAPGGPAAPPAWRRERLFDEAKLAAALAAQTGKKVPPEALDLQAVSPAVDGAWADFRFADADWRWNRRDQTLAKRAADEAGESARRSEEESRDDAARRPRRKREGNAAAEGGPPARGPRGVSPDGAWQAFVRDQQVWVKRLADGEERRLSKSGAPGDEFALRDLHWSPDSKRLAGLRTKRVPPRQIHIVESSPKDQLQPKLHTLSYPKPGDPLDHPRPVLFDLDPPQERAIDDALFPTPWSIDHCRWRPDGSEFLFLYNQRGHQVLRLVAVDAATGRTRAVIDETSPTFIDYAQNFHLTFLDATGEAVWLSERDGWNHLYLIDVAAGKVKRQLTHGPWVVREVESVDAERRQVWFEAGGIHPQQDPYHLHLARVDLDGGDVVPLTSDDGTHQAAFSPDRSAFVDRWSRVDVPPAAVLRQAADGALLVRLEAADDTELRKTGWRPPQRFTAPGRDGKTPIYGVVFLPSNYDPSKKYPVLEDIYAGPQSAYVPKGFNAYYEAQRNAELGFVVVKMDGMGTNHRSKAFHDVCCKNLGDSGFPDRILWIRAAADAYPGMDLARVGLYGGSAGGQSTLRGLLAHGDFYKAGVAFCGCHDNRMDKVWWNELWMGWPVGPHYAEQSNVTQAKKLTGKLLLVVGELDKNVDPASTMQVVDALVKADKDFDLLVIPGAGHGNGGAYGHRRCVDFFVRHLWGAEPRR